MKTNSPVEPDGGVHIIIKIIVILLTLVTMVVLGAFFIRLVNKMPAPAKISTPLKEETPGHEWLIVGDKLKQAGLRQQAIKQYEKFLQHARTDAKTRARVAQTLAGLYMEMKDCREALVWLYHAQAAGPEPAQENTLETHIDTCLQEVK